MNRADVSVELAHLYMHGLDRASALEQVRREERLLRPLLSQFASDGLTVSTSVLVDDTARAAGEHHEQELIAEVCDEVGLSVDYFVPESQCAETVTEMLTYYHPEETLSKGSSLGTGGNPPIVDPLSDGDRWLMNGEPGRYRPSPEPLLVPTAEAPADAAAAPRRQTGGRGTRSHSIHLDVELWSGDVRGGSILWSCPLLAAWWQLLRLGADPGRNQAFRSAREGAAPFSASTTLTVLPPSFLVVEDAVRTILSRVAVPPQWLDSPPWMEEAVHWLDRINYVFAGVLPSTR